MKAKVKITKNGTSYQVILPNHIVKSLELHQDEFVLLDVLKYNPVLMRLAEDAMKSGKEIELIFKNGKTITGQVTEITQESITIFNKQKNYGTISPLSIVSNFVTPGLQNHEIHSVPSVTLSSEGA